MIRRLERGHRTDCRSLTHTTDTQPTQPLHAPIPLSPSQVDSASEESSYRRNPKTAWFMWALLKTLRETNELVV